LKEIRKNKATQLKVENEKMNEAEREARRRQHVRRAGCPKQKQLDHQSDLAPTDENL
jgi:hypothetical protein